MTIDWSYPEKVRQPAGSESGYLAPPAPPPPQLATGYGGEPPGAPSSLLLLVLDALDLGLILLSPYAQVRLVNRAAQAAWPKMVPALGVGTRLALPCQSDQQQLNAALTAAALGRRSMLTLSEKVPFSICTVPINEAGANNQVLVVLGRSALVAPLALQCFSLNHGLTAAEHAVLDGLCQGQAPTQLAAAGGVAMSTVRTQIAAVRSKTLAASMVQLLQMVARLPPVAGLTHGGSASR